MSLDVKEHVCSVVRPHKVIIQLKKKADKASVKLTKISSKFASSTGVQQEDKLVEIDKSFSSFCHFNEERRRASVKLTKPFPQLCQFHLKREVGELNDNKADGQVSRKRHDTWME